VGRPAPARLVIRWGLPPPRIPAFSTEPRGEGRSSVRYGYRVTVWQTVLVFAVLPVAGLALLAVLTFGPGATRSPRYRVGKPWDYEPVWYIARPDVSAPAGSAEGRAALAAAARPDRAELPASGPAHGPASVLDVDRGTARGGASGEW